MPLYTYNPTSNQSPDATLGGIAVTSPTNTGHASTTASVSGANTQTESCRWFGLPAKAGLALSVTLKVDHSSSGSLGGAGSNQFEIDYSTNGGSTWTALVNRQNYVSTQSTTTAAVSLSLTQDVTQVQVRDLIKAQGNVGGDTASATATVSNVRIEVQGVDVAMMAMM